MNKYEKTLYRQWNKERDEAALSFNVDVFKAFYMKWKGKSFFKADLPEDDSIIEFIMRKLVISMKNPPSDKLNEARNWLLKNDYDLTKLW